MTVSMMVFICLVSFGGLGESFSAGGRPRLFLALEPPSSLPERSLSWRLLRLRFFSRISSSISSRFPSSIAWNNKEATVNTNLNSNHAKYARRNHLHSLYMLWNNHHNTSSKGLIIVLILSKCPQQLEFPKYHHTYLKVFPICIPVSLKQEISDPPSLRWICLALHISPGGMSHWIGVAQ